MRSYAVRVDASSVRISRIEMSGRADASGSLRDVRQFSQGTVAQRARRKDVKSNKHSIRPLAFGSGLVSNTRRAECRFYAAPE
jgi:hypothetical protein